MDDSLPRVLAYGGGLDSFTLLLEAIRRGIRLSAVVFCDVTDPDRQSPGEWPGTYRHIRDVAMPLCEREGIEFIWLDTKNWPVRNAPSLFEWMRRRAQIPVAGPKRICTIIAKVERFEVWLDSRFPGQQVEVWVGFDAAEEKRAAKDPNAGVRRKMRPGQAVRCNRFPLIEWKLCRCRCEAVVRAAGYPVPRKSACTFCPYASKADWQEFARTQPEHFQMVVELEAQKPPTAAGFKLSIMGFRKLQNTDKSPRLGGNGKQLYRAPPLPDYIKGKLRPRAEPCVVCGAAQRATKATGCGYLDS